MPQEKCPNCGSDDFELAQECGVKVCFVCDHHEKLARCYCGWSTSGVDGRAELEDMGEVIDEDY